MATDQTPATPTLAELEMQGMQLIPGEGEPWATRLRPPHPAYISIAAGALVTVTGSRRHAYRIAYTLHDAGLLLDPTKVLPAPIPATVDRDAAEDFRHDMAMRAFCAPDSDYDTIRASLDARIADALAASAPAPVSEDQEQREVQRVAEAIQTAALDKPGVSYLRVDYWDHEDLQNMARAAIAALREVPRG